MKHIGPTTTSVEVSPPTILTVKELSEYLRVHPATIYRLLRAKQIPGFRVRWGLAFRHGYDRSLAL
jgi:excisionase family DNA binding protein